MVRISKQAEKRTRSPRKRSSFVVKKTGPRQENLPRGYREHGNALEGSGVTATYIAKIK